MTRVVKGMADRLDSPAASDARTDADLIAGIARNDRGAFRLLYERYADRLFRYAVLRLGEEASAEDAVQETFLAVWKGAARFEGRSAPSTWLFGIAHHQVSAVIRTRSRAPTLHLPPPDLAPSELADGADRSDRVWILDAMRSLSEEHREVLFLAYYMDLDGRQMAEVCGVPEGTVKSRLFHARRLLAARLETGTAGGNAGEGARTDAARP